MTVRQRSRRSIRRRGEWPREPADELRTGVDLDEFTTKLGRFFAAQAQLWWDDPKHPDDDAVRRLEEARSMEDLL